MEPEIREFLIRIMTTISLVLSWMLANTLFGIKMGYLFWGEKAAVWHIVYYILMVASGLWLFVYLLRKWKNAPTYNRETDEWINPS